MDKDAYFYYGTEYPLQYGDCKLIIHYFCYTANSLDNQILGVV